MKDIQNSQDFQIGLISINMYTKGLNFACPLHTFAFQQFLAQNGIDSTVIDYRPNYHDDFDMRHPFDYYAKKCTQFEKDGRDQKEPQEYQRLIDLRDAWGGSMKTARGASTNFRTSLTGTTKRHRSATTVICLMSWIRALTATFAAPM